LAEERTATPIAWARAKLQGHALPADPIDLRRGWSNEVFLAPAHVLRRSSGRFRHSIRHEVEVIRLVDGAVPVPEVVAYGQEEGREWVISLRKPGQSLLQRWKAMPAAERREAVRQLAVCLEALHRVPLPPGFANPWQADAITDPGKGADAYHVAPRHYPVILNSLRKRGSQDEALLRSAETYLAERLPLFEDDEEVLIHGDAHFDNLLWDGASLTLLDLEVATRAAPDLELDGILSFLADPVRFLGPGTGEGVAACDFREVEDWLRQDYPVLFERPHLGERLEVYATMGRLLQMHYTPEGHASDPRPRLRQSFRG
jgi:aminoglycoside phosphotransferase (APT) family kinase protein